MVKPPKPLPENIVTFRVDPRMTDWDVKNYLEKIYKVQVGAINSQIRSGQLKKIKDGIAKRDDYKMVYVTLPLGQTFKWPSLFPIEKQEEQEKDFKRTLKVLNAGRQLDPNINIPEWIKKFSSPTS